MDSEYHRVLRKQCPSTTVLRIPVDYMCIPTHGCSIGCVDSLSFNSVVSSLSLDPSPPSPFRWLINIFFLAYLSLRGQVRKEEKKR